MTIEQAKALLTHKRYALLGATNKRAKVEQFFDVYDCPVPDSERKAKAKSLKADGYTVIPKLGKYNNRLIALKLKTN